MKRIVTILIVLLLTPIVLAGESIKIDFRDSNTEAVSVFQGDRIILEYFNKEHAFIINEIKESSIQVGIFPDSMNSSQIKLNKVLTGKIDLNQDKKDDITIQLYDIKNNTAIIIFQETDPEQNKITAKTININPTRTSNNKIILSSIIGFLLLSFLSLIIYKKQKFIKK